MANTLHYTFDHMQKIESPMPFLSLSFDQTQLIDDCLDEHMPNDDNKRR